ncbi:MAG TPA: ATP-binding protein [Bacteroidia bacterium]
MLKKFLKEPNKNYFYLVAGFSIIIILIAILLALHTITNNYRSLSFLDKAYGINARIDKIYSIMKYGEKRQRNYLLTDQLDPTSHFAECNRDVALEYDELYDILKEEKEQQKELIAFKVEIELKMEILKAGELYLDSKEIADDSLRKILTHGDFIMDLVRETISKIKKIEYKRFSILRETTFNKSELSITIIALTSGISILLLISILVALKRQQNLNMLVEEKLKASERRLQQQVHMLNISNKELEQFAYVASHDLEEPLRKISSLSEKITLKLDNHPDEEVTECLKRLNSSAGRMRILISDLLNYSRVTRLLDIHEEVDLNSIFKQITEDLSEAASRKNASIEVEPLDKVEGNNTQLRQLFQNLISNALKFSDKTSPLIQINGKYFSDTELKASEWSKDFPVKHKKYYCIFVKDNGIGFELQYLRQIFVIFQRLHGRSEYDGTGIGLAICKRIAENHEGFITAESEVGKGTTFIVGLPVTK